MKKKPIYVISLTGGLGNQLFQYAAGLAIARHGKLFLSSSFGKPRKSTNNRTELFEFQLKNGVREIGNQDAPLIVSKVAGYLLRIGVNPKYIESNKFYEFFVKIFSSVLFSFYFKKCLSVKYSIGIGFTNFKELKVSTLIFGYFQSYRWVNDDDVNKSLAKIELRTMSESLESFKRISLNEKPLIVHVRLGDYLSEKSFGIPSKEYYKLGIEQIMKSGNCKSIWLFSDDISRAKEFLPKIINVPIRYISNIDDSTATTFEVMRLGYGYVIANSTFSWWAAYLSKIPNVEVVSPVPWFSGLPEPIDLIPLNWLRINSQS
jgi:hypothetical protein